MASLVKEIERIFTNGVDLRLNGGKLVTKGSETSLDAGSIETLVRIKPRILAAFAGLGNGRIFPLTQGQKAQWFLHIMNPDAPSYNIGMAIRFSRRLTRSALQQALMAVSAVHESTRTIIRPIIGEPMQFAGDATFPILEGDDTLIAESELMDLLAARLEEPFHLENGPLVRAGLYDLHGDECVLLVAGHHLICDGQSVPILMEDLFTAYFSIKQGGVPSLPVPMKQFVDYCRWQSAYLATEDASKSLSYWKGELSRPPIHPVWPGEGAKGVREDSGDTIRYRLDPARCAGIKGYCRESGVTPFCFFLSALHAVLSDILGDSGFWIGSPVSARPSSGFSRTLGYFVNILLFACEPRKGEGLRDLLRRNQQRISGALRYRDYPYNMLIGKLGYSGSGNGNGAIGILINYQYSGYGTDPMELSEAIPSLSPEDTGQLRMTALQIPNQNGQFDLVWSIMDSGNGIQCDLKFRHQAVNTQLATQINHRLVSAITEFRNEEFVQTGKPDRCTLGTYAIPDGTLPKNPAILGEKVWIPPGC